MRITALVAITLLAITFELHPQDQKKALPPDRQAYIDLRKIPDPQQKTDALRKFLAQFPKSSRFSAANDLLLETLAKNFPARTGEIRKQTDAMAKLAKGPAAFEDLDNIASTLADYNLLLPRAESLSQKSLKILKEKRFISDERKQYTAAKMKAPADAELRRDFIKRRASLQTTLGRIYVKEGKIQKGEPLLHSAYAADSSDSAAAAALGELEAKSGHPDLALRDLVRARLTGKLEPAQQTLLESLYRETKTSSAESLDEFLDAQYRINFPSPFEVTKYHTSAQRSNRTVLAELFTGAGCAPCAGADLAIDGCLEKYSRQEVAVLMFHQHIPEPDPMSNPADVARFTFYDATGVPTLALDGVTTIVGASREDAKSKFEIIDKMIGKDLDLPAEASLNLSAMLEGDRVRVKVSTADIKGDPKNLRLQIVLAENRLRYSGENGIRFHPMVVRSVAGSDENGFAVDPAKPVEYSFDVSKISSALKSYLDNYEQRNDRFGEITFIEKKYTIDPRGLSVVAFLQDVKTKHILQSVYTSPAIQ